jgi:predicted SPOUT superfamily RNA methylase MTH1
MVEIGMPEPVQIADSIPPKTRLTLQMPEDENGQAEAIHPKAPREEGGYFWGFDIRKCASLSAVFTDSPFEEGYDISIGTSERGLPLSKAFPLSSKPAAFKHLLIVFGGPRGLEYASMNDSELSELSVSGGRTRELFDHWVNILPNQGSRTIRTDEAVFIGLSGLRRLWDPS